MSNPARSEEDITTCLLALIAWAGNAAAASRYLKSEKGIAISGPTLKTWKTLHGDRYDKLREQYQSQLELNLANEMRDVARLAVEVERLAIEKARKRLEGDEDQDPGRTAANLARVAQSSTDKVMTLTSRPVQITESRDASEILRRLVQMKVLVAPEEPAQIEAQVEPESNGQPEAGNSV